MFNGRPLGQSSFLFVLKREMVHIPAIKTGHMIFLFVIASVITIKGFGSQWCYENRMSGSELYAIYLYVIGWLSERIIHN